MKHKNRKRLLLCLCCALMVSALPATLTACDGDSSSGNVEAYDELGVYYCDVEGEEYVLTLNGNRFTLFVGDETKYGAYTYEGTELNLLFAGEAKTQVASLTSNGVATLTVNGTSYRFLRKTNYTVTYESNGGSAVAASTVVNGKTLAKPADPAKAGYNFVGWYTDAEFTTPFVFNSTLVTGDLKLYARYEEKNAAQNEYVVTFVVDGNVYATKKTVSGKVFDLPTPQKEGATFAGWWTSDAQDASKLTCKYEGQVLGESAKLFAVWASDAPQVSVDKTGIRWTAGGVNNSYTVKVTAPSEADNVTQTLGDSSLAYDFASKAAGEYVVEVTLGEKTTKVYYNNKQLDAVSNFSVVEPSVLVFNGVANAEKYLITVDCGNDKHTHTEFNNGTSLYFNFGNCDMQKGGIKFTVKAVANGYMTSESAEFSFSRELDNVTGLSYDAAKAQVSWNKVDNALSYVVEVKKGDATTKVNVGTDTYYSLKEYSGELTVKVYPVAAGFNSPEGVSETLTKATLATPANVHLEGKKLVWTAVEGATKYIVKIGTTETTVTTNECDLSDLAYAAEYQFSVQAIGATEDKNSLWTETLTVKADIMVDAPVYDKGVVSWTPVLDADSYGVRVNGGAVKKVDGKETSCEVTLTKAGVNTIEVCSYYRNQVITDYVAVEVFAYEIEFDSRGGSAVDSIFKAIGDKVEYPTNATYEGYIFAGWYNVPGGPENSGEQYKDGYYTNSGSTVLYAYWTPQDYEVTLSVNAEEGELSQTKGTVYYKEEYTLPVATSKDKTRVFGGWYTGPNGGGTQCTDPLGNSVGVWNTAAGLQLYAYWIDIFTFNAIDNGEAYSVSKGLGIDYVTEITIPATYNNKPVTTVEGSAFKSCTKLKTVNMPDTIQLVAIPVDGGNGTGSPFEGCR
ncbi:MAG: InlB B-repeat-containing protein, partial [Clostridia bacterium]|nr:InlB B-repeat-containing protein [Clostridia bacterium]